MAPAAVRFYGDLTAELEVVGITGTNGKTTSAFLIRALLEVDGRQTGLLGTVKSVIGGGEREVQRTIEGSTSCSGAGETEIGVSDR